MHPKRKGHAHEESDRRQKTNGNNHADNISEAQPPCKHTGKDELIYHKDYKDGDNSKRDASGGICFETFAIEAAYSREQKE